MSSVQQALPGTAALERSAPGSVGRELDRMLAGLNGPQRQAVVHEGGPLLIVAGAGSGKTRVLTHRIAYLLGARHTQPGEILAITFTNKAAGEMKERVANLVGPRARAMWVSTFHSMCVRILRAEAAKLGLKSSFTDLRPGRLGPADDDGGPRPRPGRQALPRPQPRRAGVEPEERAHRRGGLRPADGAGEGAGRGLQALPAAAAPGARHGLRRPDHEHGAPAAGVPRRRRALPAPVPARAGRRVPGHQPRPVHAGARAGRARARSRPAGRAVRRRRRRPVDLRLPRRDDPQHRRVRARLPARHDDRAGAELPLHPADPAGGQHGHRQEHRPSSEEPLDRRRRRRAHRGLRRRQRARRGRLGRRADRRAGRRGRGPAEGHRGLLPHEQRLPCLRRGLHPGRHALQGRRRRAVLRAQGGPRRAGLPEGRRQPDRHREPAPGHQHPEARHRRAGRGLHRELRRPRADPVRLRPAPVFGGR